MQPIVFNIVSSGLHHFREASAMIAAYLLGGRPLIAGNCTNDIFFIDHLRESPLERRLDFLMDFFKKEERMLETFRDMKKQAKFIKPPKTKSRTQLNAYNAVIAAFDKLWEEPALRIQERLDEYGYRVIRELKTEQIFGYMPVNFNPEKAGNLEITASDLMQLLVVGEGDENIPPEEAIYHSPELFFFGSDFLADTYEKPPVYSPQDEEANNIASIYLQHCFTFPYLNKINSHDAQLVRNGLLAAGSQAFCAAVDDWCYTCYDSESPEVRLSAFRDAVLPAAARLQQSIQRDETLQAYHQKQNEQSPVEVWMGEVPVLRIWQYYRDFKVLQDVTWQKLEALKDDPAFCHQRWPVLMLKSEAHPELDKSGIREELKEEEPSAETVETKPAKTKNEDEIKPVKKYLSID